MAPSTYFYSEYSWLCVVSIYKALWSFSTKYRQYLSQKYLELDRHSPINYRYSSLVALYRLSSI